jgi:hypothetical protein
MRSQTCVTMRRWACYVLFQLAGAGVLAQNGVSGISAMERGNLYLGSVSSGHEALVNPAVLAEIKTLSLAVGSEQRYMLKSLSAFQCSVVQPGKQISVGISIFHRGDEYFSTSLIRAAAGKRLGERLSMGVSAGVGMVSARVYGKKIWIDARIGSCWKINERLRFGLVVANPYGQWLAKQDARKVPYQVSTGIGYLFSKNVGVQFEVVHIQDEGTVITAGIAGELPASILFNLAFVSPGTLLTTVSIPCKKMRLRFGCEWNAIPGFTPSFGLLYIKPQEQ